MTGDPVVVIGGGLAGMAAAARLAKAGHPVELHEQRASLGGRWASYELAEERLVAVGGDAAAVVYHARASRKGQADDFVAWMCSVYRMIDGQPRLALYQQTTITH